MNIQTNNYESITISQKWTKIIVDSFDHWSWTKTIKVAWWSTLHYFFVMKEEVNLNLVIETWWESANIIVKWLVLAKDSSKLTLKCHAHLYHNYSEADLHIVSFLQDWSVCEIDWWVDLHEGCKKISWHLLEENIILWDKIKIKTLPMLDVRSSDVSASHWARIQKLDPKKLFYMRSRWLEKHEAEQLMIQWYVEQVFEWIDASPEREILIRSCIDYILE